MGTAFRMNKSIQPLRFTVPLGWDAHTKAQQVRRYQSNPQKAKQVYLNTLAVYAVNFYLQCQGFETDWEKSERTNPVMQTLLDIADLSIKNCGSLECRFVLPNADVVYIPAEVWDERIGYVAVQLSESLREATLLGFVERVTAQELPLEKLQPLDDLTVYLNRIRQHQAVKVPVKLSQWLEDTFEVGWQTVEAIFGQEPGNLTLAYRSRSALRQEPKVTRAKLLNLGIALGNQLVALLVAIVPQNDEKMSILMQMHPVSGERYLPPNLKLALLSESGETLQDVSSRSLDNFIQLPHFKCSSGEGFTIQVSLDSLSVTEEFFV